MSGKPNKDPDVLLAEVKCNIRSMLLSSQGGVNIRNLFRDYDTLCCSQIPFRQLGHETLRSLLLSMPDVCTCRSFGEDVIVTAIADESTQHIKKMVDRQKSHAPKRGRGARYGGPGGRVASYRGRGGSHYHRGGMTSYSSASMSLASAAHRGGRERASGGWTATRVPPRPPTPVTQAVRSKITVLLVKHAERGLAPLELADRYLQMFGQTLNPIPMGFGSLVQLVLSPPPVARVIHNSGSSAKYTIFPLDRNVTAPAPSASSIRPLMSGMRPLVADGMPEAHDSSDYDDDDEYEDEVEVTSDPDEEIVAATAAVTGRKSAATTDNSSSGRTRSSGQRSPIQALSDIVMSIVKGCPKGLALSCLSEEVERSTGKPLHPKSYGCSSIKELVTRPDMGLRLMKPSAYSDWLLFSPDETAAASRSSPSDGEKSVSPTNELMRQVWDNIREVVMPFPAGLRLSALEDHYQIRFEKPIPLSELGFTTVDNLVVHLPPDVLRSKWDADSVLRVYPHIPGLPAEALDQVIYPNDVAGPDKQFTNLEMPDLPLDEYNLEIQIAEVFTPFKFFFHLTGKSYAPRLEELMDQMELEFSLGMDSKYRMLKPTVQAGQICACPYGEQGYHRASILQVEPTRSKMYFVDYGTIDWVANENLRFLPLKFCELPTQALLGRLYGVVPPDADGWSLDANRAFLRMLQESRSYLAVIRSRSLENVTSFTLWDTSGGEDVDINKKMIDLGYAIPYVMDDESEHSTTVMDSKPSPASAVRRQPQPTSDQLPFSSCRLQQDAALPINGGSSRTASVLERADSVVSPTSQLLAAGELVEQDSLAHSTASSGIDRLLAESQRPQPAAELSAPLGPLTLRRPHTTHTLSTAAANLPAVATARFGVPSVTVVAAPLAVPSSRPPGFNGPTPIASAASAAAAAQHMLPYQQQLMMSQQNATISAMLQNPLLNPLFNPLSTALLMSASAAMMQQNPAAALSSQMNSMGMNVNTASYSGGGVPCQPLFTSSATVPLVSAASATAGVSPATAFTPTTPLVAPPLAAPTPGVSSAPGRIDGSASSPPLAAPTPGVSSAPGRIDGSASSPPVAFIPSVTAPPFVPAQAIASLPSLTVTVSSHSTDVSASTVTAAAGGQLESSQQQTGYPEMDSLLIDEEEMAALNRELEDMDVQLRFVKRLDGPNGQPVHLINIDGSGYMVSQEISSFLWPKDILATMLRMKKLDVPRLLLSVEDYQDLFTELIEFEVAGVISGDEIVDPLTVYHLSCLSTLMANFKFNTHHALALAVVNSFDAADPHWYADDAALDATSVLQSPAPAAAAAHLSSSPLQQQLTAASVLQHAAIGQLQLPGGPGQSSATDPSVYSDAEGSVTALAVVDDRSLEPGADAVSPPLSSQSPSWATATDQVAPVAVSETTCHRRRLTPPTPEPHVLELHCGRRSAHASPDDGVYECDVIQTDSMYGDVTACSGSVAPSSAAIDKSVNTSMQSELVAEMQTILTQLRRKRERKYKAAALVAEGCNFDPEEVVGDELRAMDAQIAAFERRIARMTLGDEACSFTSSVQQSVVDTSAVSSRDRRGHYTGSRHPDHSADRSTLAGGGAMADMPASFYECGADSATARQPLPRTSSRIEMRTARGSPVDVRQMASHSMESSGSRNQRRQSERHHVDDDDGDGDDDHTTPRRRRQVAIDLRSPSGRRVELTRRSTTSSVGGSAAGTAVDLRTPCGQPIHLKRERKPSRSSGAWSAELSAGRRARKGMSWTAESASATLAAAAGDMSFSSTNSRPDVGVPRDAVSPYSVEGQGDAMEMASVPDVVSSLKLKETGSRRVQRRTAGSRALPSSVLKTSALDSGDGGASSPEDAVQEVADDEDDASGSMRSAMAAAGSYAAATAGVQGADGFPSRFGLPGSLASFGCRSGLQVSNAGLPHPLSLIPPPGHFQPQQQMMYPQYAGAATYPVPRGMMPGLHPRHFPTGLQSYPMGFPPSVPQGMPPMSATAPQHSNYYNFSYPPLQSMQQQQAPLQSMQQQQAPLQSMQQQQAPLQSMQQQQAPLRFPPATN